VLRSRRRVHQKIRGHEDTCYLADEKEIELDSDGRIPEGTEIVGNDELAPGFGVFAFTLPFPATVNYVSIFVAGVRRGRRVEVGLFDVSGNKVCSALIDTDHTGVRTGEFADAVNLVPGDYFLGWASDAEIELHSLGEGYTDQLALMNAGGGAVVAGVGQSRDNALPDKLGVLTPGLRSAPILAYFKG